MLPALSFYHPPVSITSFHCPLCRLENNKVYPASKILFLGIEGKLTQQSVRDIVDHDGSLKDRVTPIKFEKEAMNNLESIIERVQKVSPIFIVISSMLRKYFTLEELSGFFKDYPKIKDLIIGKTASRDIDESLEYQRGYHFETEAEEDYELSFISNGGPFRHWLKKHNKVEGENKIALVDSFRNYILHQGKWEFFSDLTNELLSQSKADEIVENLLSQ
jgi:hypothetical protein